MDYRTPNIYDPSTLTEPYAYARANPTMFWDPNGLSTRTEGNIRIITFKLDGTRAEFEVDDQIWQQVLFGQRKWGDFGFEGAPKDGYEIHQRSQEFEEYLIVQHLKHEHLFENSKYERISGLETIGRDVAIGLYASVFAPYIGVATILGAFSPTSIIFAKYMGGSIAASYLLTQAVVIPTDAIQGTNDAEKVADAYSEIVLPVFASQYLGIAFQEGLGPGVTFYSSSSSRITASPPNILSGETEVVQRWMSLAELEATQNTGLLRGGREGLHYVTNSANIDPLRARQRLALPQTPEILVTMEVPKGIFSLPSKVKPMYNMTGGGLERIASGKIPVKILKVRQ